jgi:hypothetical protein
MNTVNNNWTTDQVIALKFELGLNNNNDWNETATIILTGELFNGDEFFSEFESEIFWKEGSTPHLKNVKWKRQNKDIPEDAAWVVFEVSKKLANDIMTAAVENYFLPESVKD